MERKRESYCACLQLSHREGKSPERKSFSVHEGGYTAMSVKLWEQDCQLNVVSLGRAPLVFSLPLNMCSDMPFAGFIKERKMTDAVSVS